MKRWASIGIVIAIMAGSALAIAGATRQFSGMINNKIPIVMKLDFNGNTVRGVYYYVKYKKDIRLDGNIDDAGNISLAEFDPANGKISGTFVGKFVNQSRIEGRWLSPDGKKSMPFYVQEGGGGASASRDQRFVGEWFCNAEGLGRPTYFIKADGSYTYTSYNGNGRGAWTSSGNTITFTPSKGGRWTANLINDGEGERLEFDSGHFAVRQ